MKPKLKWQAYTHKDRIQVIDAIKDVINSSGGYIVNFNSFSDLSLSLSIEIEGQHINSLYHSLSDIVTVSGSNPDAIKPTSKKEHIIFLNILFGSGKGDLKKEIPAVPG